MIILDILIIDDNRQITLLLSKILINKGYNVKFSNFFEESLEILRKENFDVIIIDAPMPGYERLNVISKLEKDGILQSQKVILFTGLDISNSTIDELKTKGLYSYLKKPLEVEKLNQELLSISSIPNTGLIDKRISEELTKKNLKELRSSISSLKLKLNSTNG